MSNAPTHVAYSDESYYTNSRYRAVAVVTCKALDGGTIVQTFSQILRESGVKEFKWEKLRQARERFAALKMASEAVRLAVQGKLRVDSLIWDTYDDRHRISGRDDIANLQRMYYHLFKNVLARRWPSGCRWCLYPDENSALKWATVQDYLDTAGLTVHAEGNFLEGGFRLRLARDFCIQQICEANSTETALCQLADLFAGMGVYSHVAYKKYEHWLRIQSGQLALVAFDESPADFQISNRDRERCTVIRHVDALCKRYKLRVGLKSSHGLKTHDPKYPINFWLYQPQHPEDKAPTRNVAS